ncbi:hypothetical protein J3R82DRAFT_1876 [Butyriboletus roseoflavus]|nr:hypothetical protein J3R82DRAFT_1876 [Butyriboletus roseoflavus]
MTKTNTLSSIPDPTPSPSSVCNATVMQAQVDNVETMILSHWHSDHFGGMLAFLGVCNPSACECVMDLHPDHPEACVITVPPMFEIIICHLLDDPRFEQIKNTGGTVRMSRDGHMVAGGTIYVSDEIPRVMPYEGRLLSGMRFLKDDEWTLNWFVFH